MIPYTLVCGVDASHLRQLAVTWPTWKKHKPDLLNHRMIVFRDKDQVSSKEIMDMVDHPNLSIYSWPTGNANYGDATRDKWTNPQRVKMLTGFVYISALFVKTKYWLKLDTDVVATGQPDWIDQDWFNNDPAIICHAWGFTRPAKQMLKLDAWVAANSHREEFREIASKPPLNLHPEEGSDRVCHPRIISWCGFFKTSLSRTCVKLSEASGRPYTMPVPTQDGLMWYVAKRLRMGISRQQMKKRGWSQWLTWKNIETHAREAMKDA